MTDRPDEPPRRLGPPFEQALGYALRQHGQQTRKGGEIPYIAHLMAVSSIVLEAGGDEDEAIAALLHDTAEDSGGADRLAEIRAEFGSRVADIVEACSDTLEDPKPEWRPRKESCIARIRVYDDESALRVSLADKVHNARSLLADYRTSGEALWDRFRGDRDDTLWYYASLADAFARRLPDDPLVAELDRTLAELGQLVRTRATPLVADPYGGPLRIAGSGGEPIEHLDDWRRFAAPTKGDAQWVEGRSAQESARAWLRAQSFGAPPELAALMDSRPETAGLRIGLVRPEARIALDDAKGNTRNADVLAFGMAPGGRTLMTVEAKADESFGRTVGEERSNPKLSPRSRLPERVKTLGHLLFADGVDVDPLRYQLIHGLAATVLEAERQEADQAVFAVHEFHGQATSDDRLRRNLDDFTAFMHALGLAPPSAGELAAVDLPGDRLPLFVGRAVTELP